MPQALKQFLTAEGEASLQNALDVACVSLKMIPDYGHREVCVILDALLM